MIRPIAISLSPNTELDDVLLAAKRMLNPLSYSAPSKRVELEQKFKQRFDTNYSAYAVTSGRGSLFMILDSLGVCKGDEVLVQAFTCSAAINPIIWNDAEPIYVDIDAAYNMDPKDLINKISKKTKAVIVQHTFGVPADIESIRDIANENDLVLIEDCAVSLGAKINGKEVGTFGDVAFFSFGRDKVISSVWGGMILTKREDLKNKLSKAHQSLPSAGNFWTFQQLMHPVSFLVILLTYNLGFGKVTIGKMLLFLLQKLNLLSFPITEKEKKAELPDNISVKMPGAIAALAINQLEKLEKFNKRRIELAKIYDQEIKGSIEKPAWKDGAIWLRYPIVVEDADSLIDFAKRRGVLLGDWYKQPIYPVDGLEYVKYNKDCKNVERLKNKIVNLPTYPTMTAKQAHKVVKIVMSWQSI